MVSIAKGDVPVGLDLGWHEYEITPELVRAYSDGVDDHYDWYAGSSPFGAPVAPALILHSEVYKFGGWYLPNVWGNLHARQQFEQFAPVMVGAGVSTRSTIVDRYVKRGRDYVVNEVQVFGSASGGLLSRGRTHQSFLLETQREGVAVDKEREKRSDRTFEVGAGEIAEQFEPLEKTVTLAMCQAFSGPAKKIGRAHV